MITLAAEAVLAARRHRVSRQPAYTDMSRYLYLRAMQLFRDALDTSDASLLTVALLAKYEQVTAMTADAYSKHLTGLTTMLLAQADAFRTSSIAAAFLYMARIHRFWLPVWLGLPSPFAHKLWLEMDPACKVREVSSAVQRLAKVSNQLLIRLPSLIADVRKIRAGTGNGYDLNLLNISLQLASQLSQLSDDAAESAILHQVRVRQTTDLRDRELLPYSLYPDNNGDFTVALEYWEARLVATNVSLSLLEIAVDKGITFDRGDWIRVDRDNLSQQRNRLVTNLLMSGNFIFADVAMRMVMPSVIIPLWSALLHMESFNDQLVSKIQAWILHKCSQPSNSFHLWLTLPGLQQNAIMVTGAPREGPFEMVNQSFAALCSKAKLRSTHT